MSRARVIISHYSNASSPRLPCLNSKPLTIPRPSPRASLCASQHLSPTPRPQTINRSTMSVQSSSSFRHSGLFHAPRQHLATCPHLEHPTQESVPQQPTGDSSLSLSQFPTAAGLMQDQAQRPQTRNRDHPPDQPRPPYLPAQPPLPLRPPRLNSPASILHGIMPRTALTRTHAHTHTHTHTHTACHT